jgi:hypothetical protein
MGYEPGKGLGKEGQVYNPDNDESKDEALSILTYSYFLFLV